MPYLQYRKISESNNIILQGSCTTGCGYVDSVRYKYTIFKNTGNSTNFIWTPLNLTEMGYLFGIKIGLILFKKTISKFYNLINLNIKVMKQVK